MRIIRSSGLPAIVLVRSRETSALAIPEDLPSNEVLELASLVLSASEYEKFRHTVELTTGRKPAPADESQPTAACTISASPKTGDYDDIEERLGDRVGMASSYSQLGDLEKETRRFHHRSHYMARTSTCYYAPPRRPPG